MNYPILLFVVAIISYVLGSIPFGLVLTRLAGLGDIRSIGSGNIGATNVLRTGHKGLALATLLLDGGKGAIVSLLAAFITSHDAAMLAGFCAVLGHNFPIWLKFKGGKGVATTLGVLFSSSWPTGIATCIIWLIMAFTFRYSSLAAITALAAAPFITWFLSSSPTDTCLALGLGILGIARHHQNISRLMSGKESKIGKKGE